MGRQGWYGFDVKHILAIKNQPSRQYKGRFFWAIERKRNMPVEKDALITAQAGIRPVMFHWGNGLQILNDNERELFEGSPVVIKNGSPETPITRNIVVKVCKKGKEKWFVVERHTPSINGRSRPTAELLKFSAKRVGLGRYQTSDGQYTMYNAATLGPQGIKNYLETIDSYPTVQQGREQSNGSRKT